MSVAAILDELPRLTTEERRLVADRLEALEDFSEAECSLIDQRIREHDAAPDSAIPLDQFRAAVKARYGL
jgi:hypothetical protein